MIGASNWVSTGLTLPQKRRVSLFYQSEFKVKRINSGGSIMKNFLCLIVSLLLISCGGTGQDDGKISETVNKFSAKVIDGYLARATVFVDSNNNGTRDAWEPFAFTDNDGYYSFNPITNTDYCASTATAQEQQYCLSTSIDYSNAVIRIDGGYDITTGEPFLGQMSRRIDVTDSLGASDSIVSPISALLTNVEGNDKTSLLSALGLEENDLSVDYFNSDGNGAVDTSILNSAIKIHKTVAVLSDRLTDTYTEIGNDFGTPNDATSSVYPNLASQIIGSSNSLDSVLSSESDLLAVLDASENELREIYERKELELPADLGSVNNPGDFTRVIDVTVNMNDMIDKIVDVSDNFFDGNDALGAVRALESVVIKAVNENNDSNDSTLDNALNFFNSNDNDALIDALLNSLESNSADISSLAANDFTGDDFDSVEDMEEASSLGDDVEPFGVVAGQQLKISDLDLGTPPNDMDDSEIEFYFLGDTNDISGQFLACLKHISEASSDGTISEGNSRGELIDGYWSLLGSSGSSMSLLLTIEFLGATYQGIVKPAGMETVSNQSYQRFRFELVEDFKSFHSVNGFETLNTLPASNSECEARLPSRIGI